MGKNSISGEDLFGKYTEGNLNRKGLEKAKKSERVDIVESNLPFLVDFYFGMNGKKDLRYRQVLYDLVADEKLFLLPLAKIMKVGKKKIDLSDIPNGLHVILMDSMQQNKQFDKLNEFVTVMVTKDTKKLVNFGIKDIYATKIARCFVPPKYLTKYNVGRYMYRLNRTLVDIAKVCYTKNENDDNYTSDAGVNMVDDATIMSIYEYFLRKCDRETYLSALLSVLLERRSKIMDTFTKHQKEMYNAISRVVLDLLEGTSVLNVTGEKLKKKKDIKKLQTTKKELKKIMKMYSSRREEDYRKGNDTPRRITLSSLSPDVYPNITERFGKNGSDIESKPPVKKEEEEGKEDKKDKKKKDK
jgi:hypothetical protein